MKTSISKNIKAFVANGYQVLQKKRLSASLTPPHPYAAESEI